MDPMKEALKSRAHKVSIEISMGKPGEEDSKEREALGLAPDTSKGKSGHPQPKDAMPVSAEDMLSTNNSMAEGNPPLKNSPMEDGDADLKVILSRMGDMGNVKGSLSNKAKEGMKSKLAKKG